MAKDFFRLLFPIIYPADTILVRLRENLGDFQWRTGDSDSSGPFITGTGHPENVDVQIWLDDEPVRCAVSYRLSWEPNSDRESRIERHFRKLSPLLERSISPEGSVPRL